MKKMFFVMNPYAGTRKANRWLPDIIAVFNRAGYEVTTYMTSGTGDAVRAVIANGAKADVIVCCGGDGTFNETVNGVMRLDGQIPIGYIPAGSTNDFANSLKLSSNVLEAARQIVEGTPCRLDIGKFGQRHFTYVASFGVFTKSSYTVPQNIKNALGHTAYVLSGIQELSQIRTTHVRMELEGEVVEDEFLFGAICNSTSIGGILTLDPKQVDMADGKFEVMLVRAPRDLTEIAECIQAVQKQVYNCRMITFRTASRVEVTAAPNMNWTLDGEMEPGKERITVENLHHAIQLLRTEEEK